MSKDTPAVGIDLGTTFSAVAHLDDLGRPVTLVNAEGDLVTPSVVLFEGSNVVVGKEAIKAIATEAQSVAQCASASSATDVPQESARPQVSARGHSGVRAQ